ncbi:MAG TPA: hypothetical protein VGK58_06925 [Lacipirellulaceae bacterium]
MFQNRLQSGALRKRISACTLSATLVLFGGAIMLAAPVVRTAEMNEHGSRERAEDPTLAHRVELERYLRFESRPAVFLQPAQRSLGHSQRPILEPPAGHRLANGLLAPITC